MHLHTPWSQAPRRLLFVSAFFAFTACEGRPGSADAMQAREAALSAATDGLRTVDLVARDSTTFSSQPTLTLGCDDDGAPIARLVALSVPEGKSFVTDFKSPPTTGVVVRVGNTEPSAQRWVVDRTAFGAWSPLPVTLAQSIASAKTVTLTIDRFGVDTVSMTFSAEDRERYFASIAKECRWP